MKQNGVLKYATGIFGRMFGEWWGKLYDLGTPKVRFFKPSNVSIWSNNVFNTYLAMRFYVFRSSL